MLKRINETLACPYCKQIISYDKDRLNLSCSVCNEKYFIKKGIPIMLKKNDQIEIENDLNSIEGIKMIKEFKKQGIFRYLEYGGKIVSSEFIIFNRKKILHKLLNVCGKETMILDIGAGNRRLGEEVISFDITPFQNTDVVGDAHRLPFVDNSFDVVWIEVVLEHVKNPQQVVSEIYRVLKPGGYVFSVVPFIHPYHGYPCDYNRYSLEGLDELFSKFRKEDSGTYRGPSVALINFLTDYLSLFSFSKNKKIYLFFKALALIFLFPIKYLDLILVRNSEAHKLAHTLYYLGRK